MPGVILDDAPCGAVESSPVEFNDGGTPAVEVGDRQGFLYGLNLYDGSAACQGGATGCGSGVGLGTGLRHHAVGVVRRPPASSALGCPATRPSTRRPRSGPTATSTSAQATRRNRLDGGYYAYGPNGSELWNQVVSNPASDSLPYGGVEASLPLGDGGSLA